MEEKKCRACLESLALSCFGRVSKNADGLHSSCKVCVRAYNKDYYAKNRIKMLEAAKQRAIEHAEEIAEYQRRYRQENSERLRAYKEARMQDPDVRARAYQSSRRWRKENAGKVASYSAKRRAGIKNLSKHEELDMEVLLDRDVACYLCNVAFKPEDTLHLDHKIPLSRVDLGPTHTYENCALTHSRCNLAKSDLTPEEYWAKYLQASV